MTSEDQPALPVDEQEPAATAGQVAESAPAGEPESAHTDPEQLAMATEQVSESATEPGGSTSEIAADQTESEGAHGESAESGASGSEPDADADAEEEPEFSYNPSPEVPDPYAIHWVSYDVTDEQQLQEGLAAAVTAIRNGEVIVLPTDTVYGIGADALQAAAVQRLLDAKVRGRDMPPPVLISDSVMVGSLADSVPAVASALSAAYWPGPLTLIFNAQTSLGMDLGETQGTIAVRVPDHEVTRTLLRKTGPLAVSSANISGCPASTDAAEAIEQLCNSVSIYLQAGRTPGLEPSSIVDFSQHEHGVLVRLGALSIEQLREYAPDLDTSRFEETEPEAEQPSAAESSDQADAEQPASAESAVDQPQTEELSAEEAGVDQSSAGVPAATEVDGTDSKADADSGELAENGSDRPSTDGEPVVADADAASTDLSHQDQSTDPSSGPGLPTAKDPQD